ncbi:MAG: ribonuclease Z [SAR324 cluster bacterium]|nr:ribonuclease Z [SAR324 cluster bacterium]
MKITFLGVGSAFSKINANSNLLVESGNINMLVDCGHTASASLIQHGRSIADISNIFITHLHADHIGGLEEFAFMTRLVFKKSVQVMGTSSILHRLWNHSLKGGLEFIELTPDDVTPQVMEDFFTPRSLPHSQWIKLDDSSPLEMYLHPTNHVKLMESYAVELREGDKHVLYTSDTRFDRPLLEKCIDRCTYIFHDCQLFDMGGNNDLGVHTSYNQLRSLPGDMRKKMWLYHYGDEPRPEAENEGFAGFVSQLQTFDL